MNTLCVVYACLHMHVPVCAYTNHVVFLGQHRVSSPTYSTPIVLFIFWDMVFPCSSGCPGTIILCRSSWPQTNKKWPASAGIKGMHHPPISLFKRQDLSRNLELTASTRLADQWQIVFTFQKLACITLPGFSRVSTLSTELLSSLVSFKGLRRFLSQYNLPENSSEI